MKVIKAVLLFYAVNIGLIAQTNQQIDSILQIADARIKAEAYESALKYIDIAFQINELYEDNYIYRTRAFAKMGRFNDALNDLETLKTINPGNIAVLYEKAEVYHLMGDTKKAQEILDDAIKKQPEAGELYYYRGLLANEKERYSKAIPDFEKALNFENSIEKYKIYLNKGVAHLNLLEYDQALVEHNKAIDLHNKDASLYHSRGLVYYGMGDYDDAITDFSIALQIFNENPETYFNLGMAYLKKTDKKNACHYFHKSCQFGNKNACKMVLLECTQ